MSLLIGFEGRINRARWWLGQLFVLLILIVVFYALRPFIKSESILHFLILLVIAYPVTALMMKRLRDRDLPGYLAYFYWAPAVLPVLGNLIGFPLPSITGADTGTQQAATLGVVVAVAGFIVTIWGIIDLGILKGTDGPNRHGADPLME